MNMLEAFSISTIIYKANIIACTHNYSYEFEYLQFIHAPNATYC